jgi:hypothetical protein
MSTFTLPSSMVVDLRKLDGKHMAELAEAADGSGPSDPFSSVLSRCWARTVDAGPYGFAVAGDAHPEIRRLLKGDVLRAFVAIRQISLPEGDVYDFDVKCEECNGKIPWTVNLSEVPVKALPPESIERYRSGRPFEAKIPGVSEVVHFHLQTLEQEDDIKKILKQQKRKKATLVDVLVAQTASIEGVGPDLRARWRWFSSLSMGDLLTVQEAFEAPDCGMETAIEVRCPAVDCGWEQEVAIPFGKRFFSLRKRPAKATQEALDDWSGRSGAASASSGGTISAPPRGGTNTEGAAST